MDATTPSRNHSVPGQLIRGPLHRYIFDTALFSFFTNLLLVAPAIYMLQVYDRAVAARSLDTLAVLTLILVFLLLCMGVLDAVRGQLLTQAANRLDQVLAQKVYDRTIALQRLHALRNGEQRVTQLSTLRGLLATPAIMALFDAPWCPIFILVMFLFHPLFGLFALFALALLVMVSFFNHRGTKTAMAQAEREETCAAHFSHWHSGQVEVAHALGFTDNLRNRWLTHHGNARTWFTRATTTTNRFSALSKSLRLMLQSLALGLGAYLVILEEISPGVMIAGSILLGRALAPVDQLISGWRVLSQATAILATLEALLVEAPKEQGHMALPAPTGHVELQQLSLTPPNNNTAVLQNISLDIPAGSSVGVIGPSASGKSSLAKAALGIWPPQTGVVRLDGADINQWDRHSLGPHLGYLPQNIALLPGTIAQNICRFGAVNSNLVVAAARQTGLHELILALPQGYDTTLSMHGEPLSGGQQQRVALARALYGSPKLIVLDEPDASLDDRGDAALVNAIALLREKGTALILITHRPALLSCVDSLIVLRDGCIADHGTSAELSQRYLRPKSAAAKKVEQRQ